MNKALTPLLLFPLLCGCSSIPEVLNKDLVDANLAELDSVNLGQASVDELPGLKGYLDDGYSIYLSSNFHHGSLVLSDGNRYYFYSGYSDSLFGGEVIPVYNLTGVYDIALNDLTGYVAFIEDGLGSEYFYDAYGNHLCSYSIVETVYGYTCLADVEEKTLTLSVEVSSGVETHVYSYSTGVPVEVIGDGGSLVPEGLSDLSLAGLPGYYLYSNGRYAIVYNEDMEAVSQYSWPTEFGASSSYYAAGGNVISQRLIALPADSPDYDLYDKGVKYSLFSYCFSLKNGEFGEIDLNYLIERTGEVYNDAAGKPNFALVEIRDINRKSLDESARTVIADKEGKIVSDASGIAASSFIKTKSGNYFNLSTKVLYSSRLAPIASLSLYGTPEYEPGSGCFLFDKEDGVYVYSDSFERLGYYEGLSFLGDQFTLSSRLLSDGDYVYRLALNGAEPELERIVPSPVAGSSPNYSTQSLGNGVYAYYRQGETVWGVDLIDGNGKLATLDFESSFDIDSMGASSTPLGDNCFLLLNFGDGYEAYRVDFAS